jgi:hypothetical protein
LRRRSKKPHISFASNSSESDTSILSRGIDAGSLPTWPRGGFRANSFVSLMTSPDTVEMRIPQRGATGTAIAVHDESRMFVPAKNLLDEAYFSEAFGAVSTFGLVTQHYDPPLTFGGELSFRS